MIQIEKIEIKYFRSIYSTTIENMKDVSVLSGKNDSGKSNILRALNLFFNNETDWRTPLNFAEDFNKTRLNEVRKESIKGKQYIQIKIYFIRGGRYNKSLPEKFWVLKQWLRDTKTPKEKNSLLKGDFPAKSRDRALASLQRYLNTIRYEYVPAVKDRSFFNYSLGMLQDAILDAKSDISQEKLIKQMSDSVSRTATELKNEFKKVADIDTSIQLPTDLSELFRAFRIMTGQESDMPLSTRGDGIQARFLPSLFHFISVASNQQYIWGFEEPENCLEHSMATQLADTIAMEYSKKVQIVLTSHSPAFIGIESKNTNIYRVYYSKNENEKGTLALPIDLLTDSKAHYSLLEEEIGLIKLRHQHQKEIKERYNSIKQEKERLESLCGEMKKNTSPILLVEGESDVLILEKAYEKLFPGEVRTFRILSADVSGVHETNTKAGCGALAHALKSCRKDLPITIGLFDYDEKGIDSFKLDKNFKEDSSHNNIKIHSNKHVAALIYPEIKQKKEYYQVKNLLLEFLFPEEYIVKENEGCKLKIQQKKLEKKVEGFWMEPEDTNEPHFRKIVGGKMDFAKHVVPTFPREAFENFKIILEQIKNLFAKLK